MSRSFGELLVLVPRGGTLTHRMLVALSNWSENSSNDEANKAV